MSKLERKRLKKYLDKARRETNLSLTEQEIEEIIKEGEEKTMNDKDKKEIKKKGLLGINKKTKAWLLAVLVACGVTKCTYDKVNQINENDLPEEPTLEEAQDEIRKFIEKETKALERDKKIFEKINSSPVLNKIKNVLVKAADFSEYKIQRPLKNFFTRHIFSFVKK